MAALDGLHHCGERCALLHSPMHPAGPVPPGKRVWAQRGRMLMSTVNRIGPGYRSLHVAILSVFALVGERLWVVSPAVCCRGPSALAPDRASPPPRYA